MPPRQVTLLYRYLDKPRTYTRFMVKVVPPLLMFTHWAIEVGDELGRGYMFELQYYQDDSKVRYRLPVDQDGERQHYKIAPFINNQIGNVMTSLTPLQILQIARGIIDRNPRYGLLSADCHVFALTLLHGIVDEPSFRLGRIYQLQEFLRVIVYPLGRTATELAKALGAMKDPVERKLKGMDSWLAHQSAAESVDLNSLHHRDLSRPTMLQVVHVQTYSEEFVDYARMDHDCDDNLNFVRGGYINLQREDEIEAFESTMRSTNINFYPLVDQKLERCFPGLFESQETDYVEEDSHRKYEKGSKGVITQHSYCAVSDSDEGDDNEDEDEDNEGSGEFIRDLGTMVQDIRLVY